MKHIIQHSYFEAVADVNETWAKLKSIKNYREDVGVALFARMFDFAPAVWSAFPWGRGIKSGSDLKENKEFVAFARRFMGMLDMAIDMLGPDMDMVEEELQRLGIVHIGYGVMPKHYPLMGKALVEVLEEKLGSRFFSKQHHESWNTMYTFMSVSMMQGAFQLLVNAQTKAEQLEDELQELKIQKSDAVLVKKKKQDRIPSLTSSTSSSC